MGGALREAVASFPGGGWEGVKGDSHRAAAEPWGEGAPACLPLPSSAVRGACPQYVHVGLAGSTSLPLE